LTGTLSRVWIGDARFTKAGFFQELIHTNALDGTNSFVTRKVSDQQFGQCYPHRHKFNRGTFVDEFEDCDVRNMLISTFLFCKAIGGIVC